MGLYVNIETRTKSASRGVVVLMGTYDEDSKPFTLSVDSELVDLARDRDYYLQQCAIRHCEELVGRG